MNDKIKEPYKYPEVTIDFIKDTIHSMLDKEIVSEKYNWLKKKYKWLK